MVHWVEGFPLAFSRNWLALRGLVKPKACDWYCGGAARDQRVELIYLDRASCTTFAILGVTSFCLKLSLLAALPGGYGGLDGRVIYIDTESKFNSRRMIEIGTNSFPKIFLSEGMAKEMAGRIIVLRRTSLSEITESLQHLKLKLLQHEVKLLIIDSMASLFSGENERSGSMSRNNQMKCPFSFLKSIAEFARIPIVVTNQVRSHNNDETSQYPFLGKDTDNNTEKFENQVAALGIQWAHAVTIRLIFEAHSGQKFIKVAKSPISPPLAFPFTVCSSGISLLSDDGIEMMGREISMIRCDGHNILNE